MPNEVRPIWVIDTETTGKDEPFEVCEIGIRVMAPLEGGTYFPNAKLLTSLIKPNIPITHGARAAHHISDDELETAPKMSEYIAKLFKCANHSVIVAGHNVKFDLSALKQSGCNEFDAMPHICTWRCALHLYPEAESHTNGALFYFLGLEKNAPYPQPSHRALPDAIATSRILLRMLETNTVERLLSLSKLPVLLGTIRFGKYAGQKWADIDSGYLNWLLSKDFDEDVKHTATHYLTARKAGRTGT